MYSFLQHIVFKDTPIFFGNILSYSPLKRSGIRRIQPRYVVSGLQTEAYKFRALIRILYTIPPPPDDQEALFHQVFSSQLEKIKMGRSCIIIRNVFHWFAY